MYILPQQQASSQSPSFLFLLYSAYFPVHCDRFCSVDETEGRSLDT